MNTVCSLAGIAKHKLLNLTALMVLASISTTGYAIPVLDQLYEPTVGCCFGIGQASTGGAQTFTVGISGQLTGFDVTLDGHPLNGYDGDVTFQIMDSSFSTSLFSTTVAKTTIDSTQFLEYFFDVSSAGISVSTGDVLAIAITETGLGALSWRADFIANATYAGGTSWALDDNTNTWYTVQRDGAFHTYVEARGVPEPLTVGLLSMGLLFMGLTKSFRA